MFINPTYKRYPRKTKRVKCYLYDEVDGRKMIAEGFNSKDVIWEINDLEKLGLKIPKGKGEWI